MKFSFVATVHFCTFKYLDFRYPGNPSIISPCVTSLSTSPSAIIGKLAYYMPLFNCSYPEITDNSACPFTGEASTVFLQLSLIFIQWNELSPFCLRSPLSSPSSPVLFSRCASLHLPYPPSILPPRDPSHSPPVLAASVGEGEPCCWRSLVGE